MAKMKVGIIGAGKIAAIMADTISRMRGAEMYAVASRNDKEAMFLEYSELLNCLDSGATTKLTISNRQN